MSAREMNPHAAQKHAALDTLIDSLADHRRYNAQLVPELTDLLSSLQASISKKKQSNSRNVATSSLKGNAPDDNAAFLGKQVKRLFNQSLATLTKWSEVVKPDSSDIVARETASTVATTSNAGISSATTTVVSSTTTTTISNKTVVTTKHATAIASTAVNRSRSGSVVKSMRPLYAAKDPSHHVDDNSSQRRVGLMRGARKDVDPIPGITKVDMKARTNKPTIPGTSRAVAAGAQQVTVMTESSAFMTGPSSLSLGNKKVGKQVPIYDTDQPTFVHITVLIDVGFLGVRILELMGNDISTSVFEIEKARSNLISKVIQLGMKKRALQELGFLREQLIQCAVSIWGEKELGTKNKQEQQRPRSRSGFSAAPSSSVDSIKTTYQHLFTFPFPRALQTLVASSTQDAPPSAGSGLDQALTFIRLVQALHNNTLRCWMDVRNGSLAYLLPEMMSQPESPYDWCMFLAKVQRQAGLQSLDALFRLLFIGAGNAVENNPTREGHYHAFMLRMHGMRYYAAHKHLSEIKDGMIWDKILRCGVEYEKATRDGRSQEDIPHLVNLYRVFFQFLVDLETIDISNPRFQEWYKHLHHFAHKVNDEAIQAFVQKILDSGQDQDQDQDQDMTEATTACSTQQLVSPTRHLISPTIATETKQKPTPVARSATASTVLPTAAVSSGSDAASAHLAIGCLKEVVVALRSFEDALQNWLSAPSKEQDVKDSMENAKGALSSLEHVLPSIPSESLASATLQNIARIFRSMDNIRSIGSKIMDKLEKGPSVGGADIVAMSSSRQMSLLCLRSTLVIIQSLSTVSAGLWSRVQIDYVAVYKSDSKAVPNPAKLSCARVDAILFLFRLHQSNLSTMASIEVRAIEDYLESAFTMAKEMQDSESLPWISNALYNHGGALFKAGKREEAIRPLRVAIECYQAWLGEDLLADASLEDSGDNSDGSKVEARLVLANRYEVLGVCLQAVNNLKLALECFNSGLCILPLSAFHAIDMPALTDIKTSQLPAAKLLNRRARALLTMQGSSFESVLISVPEFKSKMTQPGIPLFLCGIVQEFECNLLSVLSVRTNQVKQRLREQSDILKHLMSKIYKGGRALTNPIRRARVLVKLAVLHQDNSEKDMQQEALHLVEEAIEILKERDLKADRELEPVRNHHLAIAYSWYGVLDRCRTNGLSRKSKPFQIALQLWEIALSDIECFISCEDLELVNHRSKVEQALKQLPEPELLFDHLQMLSDCLGMNDYLVLQVQICLLMLKLCNGVMTVTEDTCADAVRIYARMGQAYLALGYSGKAKMALNHGKLLLEEMSRTSKQSIYQGEVYTTWLLVYSLYLTSVGHKLQGVTAYNQARHYSDISRPLIHGREGTSSTVIKKGSLSRKVEAKVHRALILVEASLARSQLLYYEGDLSEAILDSKRAGRQLSRIVSSLSTAIKAANRDPDIVAQQPMENPFLVQEQPTDPRQSSTQDRPSVENRQLHEGLEMLANQRYQWSIFRLLIEAYHQLGKLYLVQGSVREAQYFVKEGKRIALLSKAGKSMDRFILEEAELGLRKHEWLESERILQDLAMQEDESNAGALAWEVQDARIQLLNGDLYFAIEQWDLSLKAYYRTDDVLSHLMDKSFILGLEQLVIREPQTPREAKLVTVGRRQGIGGRNAANLQFGAFQGPTTPDQAQFECVTLGGIKAALGYRTSLIFGQEGQRAQAYGLLERARAEDPMLFTLAEYHFTKAKVMILELKDAMAKHLLYAMIPDSALSVGLFMKTRTQQVAAPPAHFSQASVSLSPFTSPGSLLSSPSVRVTRMTRRRRSQLAYEPTLGSPSRTRRGAVPSKRTQHGSRESLIDNYHKLLTEAQGHLSEAYRLSAKIDSPHVVSDICAKQVYLSVLESTLYNDVSENSGRAAQNTILWAMANRAACYLEMAKAVTQHREMHGLIKQKLNPESLHDDHAWPRDIQVKDSHALLNQQPPQQLFPQKQKPFAQRRGNKTINYVGLEKPRRLQLSLAADDDDDNRDLGGHFNIDSHDEEEEEEDMDLKEVGMNPMDLKTRRGKREYFDRQSRLRPSTAHGNERSFLEILSNVYERDALIMEDQPETFQRDFIDILPDNWTVVSLSMDVEQEVLYVNRMRANAMPLVVRLPLNRAQLRESDDQDLGLKLGLGLGFDNEEDSLESIPPLSFKDAVEELQDILKESHETLAVTSNLHATRAGLAGVPLNPADLPRDVKANWWNQRLILDNRLAVLLAMMEEHWLCGLKGLIQSHNTPANAENLMEFKKTLEWIMSQAVNTMSSASSALGGRAVGRRVSATSSKGSQIQLEVNIELCRVILHLGDQPSFAVLKDLIYFLLDAYLYQHMTSSTSSSSSSSSATGVDAPPPAAASTVVEYSEVQFGRIALQIKEALHRYWLEETKANNSGFDDGAHVILILDKHLQTFPWESCPGLRSEAVSRVPSMCFLRDRILQQKYLISKEERGQDPFRNPRNSLSIPGEDSMDEAGEQWGSEWRDLEVDPQKTFYVLNPEGDLKNTEDEFKEYVGKQQGWDGIIGRAPLDLECIDGLSKNDLYIYFGHSGGEQYVKSTQIRQLGHCAVSLLLGCSSGQMRGGGEFDPTGNAMNYLLAGCPTVVANLWDVTDKDLDRFSMAAFRYWGLEENLQGGAEGSQALKTTKSFREDETQEMEGIEGSGEAKESDKTQLSLVEAVKEAREECRLKYLVGAASVVYGIPCFLKRSST